MDRATVRAMVDRQMRAWMDEDLEAIVADFAPDGVFIAPSGRWQGHAAIRQAAVDFYRHAHQVRIELKSLLLDGDNGALEWSWNELRRSDGRRYAGHDGIIFTLRGGLIGYWREYFDTAEMAIPLPEE